MTGTIRIKVQPGASQDEVCGPHGDATKIRLRARAVDGKANAALVEFVASQLGVPRSSVRIRSGAGSRTKTLEVDNIESRDLAARLSPNPGESGVFKSGE